MSKIHLLLFSLAALAVSGVVVSRGQPSGTTVVRVVDGSGEPYADAVLLVNPGWYGDSVALVTDRRGKATLPKLNCKVCVMTVLDPKRMFFDKTTEFEGGTPSVTLTLRVRPVIDKMFDPRAIEADVQVKAPDGKALPEQAVLVRRKVGTMEDNKFSVVTTDRTGRISLKLRPGEYVLASLVGGRFLEGALDLAPEVRRRCSKAEARCFIDAASRRPPTSVSVSLTTRSQ